MIHFCKKNFNKTIPVFIILFILTGCGNTLQKPSPNSNEVSMPKLPKVLSEIEEDILKVIYDIDTIPAIEEAMKQKKLEEEESRKNPSVEVQQSEEVKDEKKSESKDEKSQQEDSKQSEGSEKINLKPLVSKHQIIIPLLDASDIQSSFINTPTLPKDIDEVWSKINTAVADIHKKWNNLEAQLVAVNVSYKKCEEFEAVLDNFTLSIMNREELPSLKLGNELTRIASDFRNYFNGSHSHNIYGMYYHVRGSILFAASNNYLGALEHLNEASKLSTSLRQNLTKQEEQDTLQKLDLSIEDLRKQLSDENFYLSQVKAPIVIKNIKLAEDVFKTQIR